VLSKSAKKNAKRREKKDAKEPVRDDWEDEEDENAVVGGETKSGDEGVDKASKVKHTTDQPNWALAAKGGSEMGKLKGVTAANTKDGSPGADDSDGLVNELEKLEVR